MQRERLGGEESDRGSAQGQEYIIDGAASSVPYREGQRPPLSRPRSGDEVTGCGAGGNRQYQATVPIVPCIPRTLYPLCFGPDHQTSVVARKRTMSSSRS